MWVAGIVGVHMDALFVILFVVSFGMGFVW